VEAKTRDVTRRYQRGELNAAQAQLELLVILIEAIENLAAQIKPKPRKSRKTRADYAAERTDDAQRK
jgi:hypothetical protein